MNSAAPGADQVITVNSAAPGADGAITINAAAPGTGGAPSAPGAPPVADAFAFLSPCNINVSPGVTFTLDLMINAGTNTVVGQQSYLTFTNSLLQVVNPALGCGHPVDHRAGGYSATSRSRCKTASTTRTA